MQTTARKGFPRPEITDAAGSSYTVGPAGRTFSITGKRRDTPRAISDIADNMLEYNQNEAVTGSFDFQSMLMTEKGAGNLFTNRTGSTRALGDVVMIDPANDTSFIQPTAAGVSAGRIGVVAESINNSAVGRVAFNGFIRVKVAGGVTRNQYLSTQNASYVASGAATSGAGSFAMSVTVQDGSSMVLAYLHPGSGVDPETQFIGTSFRSNAAAIISSDLAGKLYFFGFRATSQTVALPDPTITERPISISAEGAGSITISADGGSALVGGSADPTTGAVTNGLVRPGEAFTYKSNGTQWRSV